MFIASRPPSQPLITNIGSFVAHSDRLATGGPRALEKDERLLLLFVARHDAAYSWARIVDTLGELRALLAEFGIAPARG